jgi:hypothetical protein
MKFYGEIGFGVSKETKPGVYTQVIETRHYYGDVVRDTRKLTEADKINNDLTIGNSISIVADAYAAENFWSMQYVKYGGVLWIINSVEVQSPRLLLRLGGVYNGPATATI